MREGGWFWISVKREWVIVEPDNLEMQTVSMIRHDQGMVFGIPATISPAVLLRLGILDTG